MANGMYPPSGPAYPASQTGEGLVSLYNGISGLLQRPQRREAAQQYITLIGETLRSHGTEEANQLADQWYQNPQGFYFFMQDMGGLNALNTMLAQHAQMNQQRALMSMVPADTTERQLALGLGGTKAAFDLAKQWSEAGPEEYKAQTNIEKLQEALRQAKERGDEKAAQEIENALVRAQYGSQTEVSWGPEGGSVVIGPKIPGKSSTTPPMKAKLETDIYNYTNRLERLRGIQDAFNPTFHKIPSKLWAAGAELYEKLQSGEETLTGEERRFMEDFTTYRTAAYTEMNSLLRELSGAAVNPQEAERLLEQIVDVGKHWWQGDSPTVARRKYETAIMMVSRMKARSVFMRNHPGDMTVGKYSLDRIYEAILDRAAAEMKSLKNRFSNISDAALRSRINGVILENFGVTVDDVKDPRNVR